MRPILGVSLLVVLGGCAQPMQIAESQIGESRATLRMEAPELAGYVSVPLLSHKVVNVTLSRFPGCVDGAPREEGSTELGKATLTPKQNSQTVSIPAGVELAIFAESSEVTGGGGYSCGMAVRFRSEPGGQYVLRFKPPPTILRPEPHPIFSNKPSCDMAIRELRQGVEGPVASARFAVLQDKGAWEGRKLNLCLQ